MRFFSSIRLLMLAIWIGAAVFFIAVAQSAFAVLPQRELAGAVVNRTLSILNIGGMVISMILLLSSLIGTALIGRFMVWAERALLLVVLAACAVGQFVIGWWLASVRAQIGKPIDEVALDDPLRVQFNMLHEYSVWVLFSGMVAAAIVFLLIANRRNVAPVPQKADPFDFSKEFKV